MELELKEKQLIRLAQEIYQKGERRIKPRPDWILVRVLPKGQRTAGGILLPQTQNKVLYEGIVLETWEPYETEFSGSLEGGYSLISVRKESLLKIGDRVLFPHFEGLPVPFLDEHHYRIIKESVVQGTLYYEEDDGMREKLDEIFKGMTCRTLSGV